MELVPAEAELRALRAMVGEDLPDDGHLADLVGDGWFSADDPVLEREQLPRVRPILVALAARAAGAHQVEGEPLYAAELLHMALRVHDLALGRQGGRRRRVARKVVRRSVAWLNGNHLTLRALELCRHTSPEILGELVDTLRELSDGQELCRELRGGSLPTRDDWLEHADTQTGALFAFCCRAGGHLAGADAARLSALGRYGRHLGRLWHIAEDLAALDHGDAVVHLIGRAQVGRPALPVVAAIEREPALGPDWLDLVARQDPGLAATLVRRVLEAGRAPARQAMAREAWVARRALRSLPDTTHRAALDRLAAGLARAGAKPGA